MIHYENNAIKNFPLLAESDYYQVSRKRSLSSLLLEQ